MRMLRLTVISLFGFGVTAVAVAADSNAALDDAALLAELEGAPLEADFALPVWDLGADVSIGAGYQDNVLLAAFDRDSSAFLRASIDVFAWRYPTENGVEWVSFFDAETSHFFSAAKDDSLLAISHSEWRWRPNDRWRLSVGAQLVHQDEVIDASTLDSGLTSVEAQLDSLAIEPSVEWVFSDDWSWIAEFSTKYDDFHPPLDDSITYAAESGLRRELGRLGNVQFTYGYVWRNYMDRPQSAVGGRPLDGTKLRVGQHKLETRYRLQSGKAWRRDLDLRASYLENEDNGPGWYDYDRRVVSASWSVRDDQWSIETDAGWRRYDYRVQTVGFGNPPKRERTEWTGLVRVERSITEYLRAFGEFAVEHSVSNDPFLDYDDRVVLLGLTWSR